MKLLYVPARMIAHLVGGILGKKLNAGVWAQISDKPMPPSDAEGQTLAAVAGAAALQAAIAAAAVAVADQLAARAFHYLLGAWPAQPEDEKRAKKERKRAAKQAKREAKQARQSELHATPAPKLGRAGKHAKRQVEPAATAAV